MVTSSRSGRHPPGVVGDVSAPASAAPKAKPTSSAEAACNRPESDADALVILNAYYPNRYVWNDANITVAVAAAPTVSPEQLAAIRRAIATWSAVLQECFDGHITLTDVTGSKRQAADIVVHYVPTAGGTVFGGYAICGVGGCLNISCVRTCRRVSGSTPTARNTCTTSLSTNWGTRWVWDTPRTCSRAPT